MTEFKKFAQVTYNGTCKSLFNALFDCANFYSKSGDVTDAPAPELDEEQLRQILNEVPAAIDVGLPQEQASIPSCEGNCLYDATMVIFDYATLVKTQSEEAATRRV